MNVPNLSEKDVDDHPPEEDDQVVFEMNNRTSYLANGVQAPIHSGNLHMTPAILKRIPSTSYVVVPRIVHFDVVPARASSKMQRGR